MEFSCMETCDWDKSVAKYWYYDCHSGQTYGLEEGLDGKRDKILAEKPVWID